jgi:hypothetical protein
MAYGLYASSQYVRGPVGGGEEDEGVVQHACGGGEVRGAVRGGEVRGREVRGWAVGGGVRGERGGRGRGERWEGERWRGGRLVSIQHTFPLQCDRDILDALVQCTHHSCEGTAHDVTDVALLVDVRLRRLQQVTIRTITIQRLYGSNGSIRTCSKSPSGRSQFGSPSFT